MKKIYNPDNTVKIPNNLRSISSLIAIVKTLDTLANIVNKRPKYNAALNASVPLTNFIAAKTLRRNKSVPVLFFRSGSNLT